MSKNEEYGLKSASEYFEEYLSGEPLEQDAVESVIMIAQKEAYNKAIEDATNTRRDYIGNDYLNGYVKKEWIEKLKK